jgi:hypothetical protein
MKGRRVADTFRSKIQVRLEKDSAPVATLVSLACFYANIPHLEAKRVFTAVFIQCIRIQNLL